MDLQTQSHAQEIEKYLEPFLTSPIALSMDTYLQHGTTSPLQHCLSVTRVSYAIAASLHLHLNYENLVVGAFLHDFYLYDWHTQPPKGVLHGFAHSHIASQNATFYFQINPEVQHIIRTHMWLLTLRFLPRSKEVVVVCVADKYCSAIETTMGWILSIRKFCLHRRSE